MTPFPSLFVSHGAPDLVIQPIAAADFLKQLGPKLGRPQAILVVSAHWLSRQPTVNTTVAPATIHDFYGFPSQLYELQYPAPGAPDLAEKVAQLLNAAGFGSETDSKRGLDHGAWEPLMLMYPEANIPVIQLSLQPQMGPTHSFQIGQALAPLREEGILILASGAVTHNLRTLRSLTIDAEPPEWVTQFDQWVAETIAHQRLDDLLDYRRLAPHAAENHPSEEHFLPLMVAWGAGGRDAQGSQLHSSFTYSILSMAAYAFQ